MVKRSTILMGVLTAIVIASLWVAAKHPIPGLKDCQFIWFGPSGFWDCPK